MAVTEITKILFRRGTSDDRYALELFGGLAQGEPGFVNEGYTGSAPLTGSTPNSFSFLESTDVVEYDTTNGGGDFFIGGPGGGDIYIGGSSLQKHLQRYFIPRRGTGHVHGAPADLAASTRPYCMDGEFTVGWAGQTTSAEGNEADPESQTWNVRLYGQFNGTNTTPQGLVEWVPNTHCFNVNTIGGLRVPVGTTAERPASNTGVLRTGHIRFNTEQVTFEGYDGNAWGSLGGVKSVDQRTFIRAEDFPNASNDQIDFFVSDSGIDQSKLKMTVEDAFTVIYDNAGGTHFATMTGAGTSNDFSLITPALTAVSWLAGQNRNPVMQNASVVIDNTNGHLYLKGQLNIDGATNFGGALNVGGATTLDGNVTLGNANTDNIVFSGDVNSSIIPNTDFTFNLGQVSTNKRWNNVYGNIGWFTDIKPYAGGALNGNFAALTGGCFTVDADGANFGTGCTVRVENTTNAASNNNGAFSVAGGATIGNTLRVTGDIVAFASSDARLKGDIKNIEEPLDKVKQLNGVNFKWNSNAPEWTQDNPQDVGVIAQEVQKVLPEAVTERPDGYKAVDYKKLVPLLLESIKELSARVEQLEQQQ